MSYRVEKETGDLVIDGWENGISPSPHKGIANMQNVNISTETGEVMTSFGRVAQQQTAIAGGTLTASVGAGATLLAAPSTLKAGQWIDVSASTIPSVTSSASYLVVGGGGGGGGAIATEASGGGGAGGLTTGTFTPTVQAYAITVGAGGAGGLTGVIGTNGGYSVIGVSTASLDYLVVAGGGGGGGGGNGGGNVNAGGGGGAGGMKTGTLSALTAGTYTITVGAGGAGGTGGTADAPRVGTSGGNSSIGSQVVSTGGGGGGPARTTNANSKGADGGSGGGGGASTSGAGTVAAGAASPAGQGNAGGTVNAGGSLITGAGGGGATAAGTNAGTNGGDGGAGTASAISGASVSYAGGGAGGADNAGGGSGGTGGTGGGGAGGTNGVGTAGTANRGGGGGGGGGNNTAAATTGGAGGSGVVVVSFLTGSIIVNDHTNGTVTTSGGNTIITWNSTGSFDFSLTMMANGGGGGATPDGAGANGGSGGGGSAGSSTVAGTGISGQGHNGGTGFEAGDDTVAGGGGGGAGVAGSNAAANTGGAGGNGSASSITGTSVTYAGGGAGGDTSTTSSGGTGGGGGGMNGVVPTTYPAGNGVNGLGGGGGGNYGAFSGGAGGSGVVIISYATGTMSATGGTVTSSGGNTIHTFYASGTFTVQSVATSGRYFVSFKNTSNQVKLSAIYDPTCLYPIAHGTTGTATFSTTATVNQAISKATEKYSTSTTTEYRYYILDANGYVWVYDTAVYTASLAASGVGTTWMLPDPTDNSAQKFTSIAVLGGWLFALNKTKIQGKATPTLGAAFATLDKAYLQNPFSTHTNFALTGHQGRMYYCDGNYIGSLFADTSVLTGAANIQSLATYTATGSDPSVGSTGTVTSLILGSLPYTVNSSNTTIRIPAVFFPESGGTQPAGLTAATIYYIQVDIVAGTFQVYTTLTGGNAITFSATGTQYFNTFYPFGSDAGVQGTHATTFFSPQRVNLPEFEVTQSLIEIDNTVIIGCQGSTVYPWNQIDVTPSGLINLPESNVQSMVTVNQMGYIFAGNKGNVYITDGSTASLVIKVPDYCAGIAGTVNSYVEPYFSWGDSMYVRGRVYFSILDQTATKTGNCGGVWSFTPTQNLYLGADTGLSLKLENQNSYGTYNGLAPILIAAVDQAHIGTQYWAAWYSSISAPTYGIDFTDTVPATTAIIETDIIPTGTLLKKETFKQLEFKLATPLANGESVALAWRLNRTDAFTSAGTAVAETNPLSGYFPVNFQKGQWLQLQATVTSLGTASGTFVPLCEIRVR